MKKLTSAEVADHETIYKLAWKTGKGFEYFIGIILDRGTKGKQLLAMLLCYLIHLTNTMSMQLFSFYLPTWYLAKMARAVNCAERLQLSSVVIPFRYIEQGPTDNEEQANPG